MMDLVFTSDPNSIDEVTNVSALGSSDHYCLLWNFKCYEEVPNKKHSIPKFNYRKGNYNAMNDHFMRITWAEILDSDSIQVNWDIFKELVLDATSKYVPTTISRPNSMVV